MVRSGYLTLLEVDLCDERRDSHLGVRQFMPVVTSVSVALSRRTR